MIQSQISQQLALMQLADSFFPTGSFTLSHGVESLVQTGKIQSVQDLQVFLQLLLHNKVGTTDLVALLHSHRGIKDGNLEAARQADRQLFAQTAIAKIRETQRQSGRALLMVSSSTWQDERLEILNREAATGKIHCLHPVIFGAVAAIAGLSEQNTVLAFLHSLVTSILSAAIRLGVLGHIQTQQILRSLAPDLEAVWSTAKSMNLEQMWSCTPSIDLAQMQHPKLAQRLFAN
ncbi:MAG: urease accessory protein UreF [Pleurocapsa sp. SU_5_0]|nr:urease accessory protein UreF [Pleurocapsa sp. SU_5_0]NJO98275.1 urease accessory protein UreF [Pleurocapsa sp. CRU_1_2]NJR47520.1 urease accessory protein UreF [Hyellaceae cyanobacterium CSU_1_1]